MQTRSMHKHMTKILVMPSNPPTAIYGTPQLQLLAFYYTLPTLTKLLRSIQSPRMHGVHILWMLLSLMPSTWLLLLQGSTLNDPGVPPICVFTRISNNSDNAVWLENPLLIVTVKSTPHFLLPVLCGGVKAKQFKCYYTFHKIKQVLNITTLDASLEFKGFSLSSIFHLFLPRWF